MAKFLTPLSEGLLRLVAPVNIRDSAEEPESVLFWPLEDVPPDDGTEATAVTDGPYFVQERSVGFGSAIGENPDASASSKWGICFKEEIPVNRRAKSPI